VVHLCIIYFSYAYNVHGTHGFIIVSVRHNGVWMCCGLHTSYIQCITAGQA
jgi:hypothetical protein